LEADHILQGLRSRFKVNKFSLDLDPASTYYKHSLQSVSGLATRHRRVSPQPYALPTALHPDVQTTSTEIIPYFTPTDHSNDRC